MLVLASYSSALLACSWTSEGGLTGRYESTHEILRESAADSWDGAPLSFGNTHGSIQVVGVSGKTNISVHARFVAGANNQADADAAFADTAGSIVIERSGDAWNVRCDQAKEWHGSVDPASTGCTSMRIEVPTGSVDAPLSITGRLAYGGMHVSGVTVAALDLEAPFGLVADVVPTTDAALRVHALPIVSGMCSSVLRVPPTTAIRAAKLSVDRPDVEYVDVPADNPRYWGGVSIEGFADAPHVPVRTAAIDWQRGSAPFDVAAIELHASIGKAILTTGTVPAYDPFNECTYYEPVELELGQ